MNGSSCAGAVAEAFETYLEWEVHQHKNPAD